MDGGRVDPPGARNAEFSKINLRICYIRIHRRRAAGGHSIAPSAVHGLNVYSHRIEAIRDSALIRGRSLLATRVVELREPALPACFPRTGSLQEFREWLDPECSLVLPAFAQGR